MSGDTEAMTRTTDIAHFYKVTTEPDPEWGSGLSAPELGKLLEGAYITSTDKTISFVVGGVGKTKCKTAWEFDAHWAAWSTLPPKTSSTISSAARTTSSSCRVPAPRQWARRA